MQRSPSAIAGQQTSAFQRLVSERNRFITTMTAVFLVLYLLLPILSGYDKPLMATKVAGNITFGYLFAFFEFIMGWVMAGLYVARARSFDRLAEEARR